MWVSHHTAEFGRLILLQYSSWSRKVGAQIAPNRLRTLVRDDAYPSRRRLQTISKANFPAIVG